MFDKIAKARTILSRQGLVGLVRIAARVAYQRFLRRPAVIVLKRLFRPRENRVNIGGGNWYHPGWQNLDFYADRAYVDHFADLRTNPRLPFADESVKYVYSSHVLEHISDDNCQNLLNECHRVMKRNGIIRIAVPDMDKAFAAYRRNDMEFFRSGGAACIGDSIERLLVNYFASYALGNYSGGPIVSDQEVIEHFNLDKFSFCRWCVSKIPENASYVAHVNAYDYDKLYAMLQNAGFRNIVRSSFRASSAPALRSPAFDNRPVISLYVEAEP